ncbi:hypothetical protein D3C84_1124310 [compost metagenome]
MPTFRSFMRAMVSSSIFFLSMMRSRRDRKPSLMISRPRNRFSAMVMAGATARS